MRKENLVLGGIFLVLLVLAFVFEPMMAWKKSLGQPDNFLSDIKFEEVTNINIQKDGETLGLERQGDKWKIVGTKGFYVRDTDAIFEQYLKDAIEADLELVSNNKEKKAEFDTSDAGALVKLESGDNVLAEFIIGKATGDYSGTYISLPESDETYKLTENIAFPFSRSVDAWYDLNIFSGEYENVNKIRFQYPNSEFTLEKIEDTWSGTLPYSFKVDEEKVVKILETMTALNATEIPEQTFEGTGLENHSIIVEVSGEGISNTIMVGGANENGDFFAKRGSSDNIYLISPENKEILETSIRGLR